jgi:FixJ family two-component response regulator
VVDDDPSVCKALRRLLQSAEMDVETYTSGESFLRIERDREPDCLVLDICMPGLSGPDLYNRLLDRGATIPVVFITALGDDGGTDDGVIVLRKPFEDEALLDAIRRATQSDPPADRSSVGPKAYS